jgi:hypothetical protein
MLDIRFWREGEQTAFDVIKGDRKLVQRRDIATEGVGLSAASELPQTARASAERSGRSGRNPRAAERTRSQSR